MNDPQTQKDIVEQIGKIEQGVINDIQGMSDEQFTTGTAESWSAADYLKHLLLSVKPVAKALGFPAAQLQSRFGTAEQPSRSYAEVVKAYQKRLDEGVRAEDYDRVVPAFYRFPEGTSDERSYLVQSWREANVRLAEGTQRWSEEELDTLQLPHPAIGMTTLREILYFTLYHNTLHWHDIQHAGGL